MIEVRRANPEDAPEVVRLRAVMLADVAGTDPAPGAWQDAATRTLRTRLAEPDGSMAVYAVDAPEVDGRLAACAVGTIEYRLGGPQNPAGVCGYVFNVVTDREYRRRGYSRACMTGLLAWYRTRGVTRVDLRASAAGEPLYRSLGFVRSHKPAMRLMASGGWPQA